MKEGTVDTFMIIRERKWYEFFMPNPIALMRGIKNIKDAKIIIDTKLITDEEDN